MPARLILKKQLLDYQNQAMRTLGFAYQIIEDGQDESFFVNGRLHNTDLTYLGNRCHLRPCPCRCSGRRTKLSECWY